MFLSRCVKTHGDHKSQVKANIVLHFTCEQFKIHSSVSHAVQGSLKKTTHTPASPLCPNFTPHTAVKVCSRDVNEIVLTTVTDTSHLRASYGGATLFAVAFLQLLCGTALRVVAGRLCSRPSIHKDRLFACFLAATLGRVVLVRAQFFATNFISSFRAVDTSFGSS